MNFSNDITEIHLTAQALPVKYPSESAWMIYQFMNCDNQVAENGKEKKKIVVAEIWGGIKKKECYVHNIFTTFSQQITGD